MTVRQRLIFIPFLIIASTINSQTVDTNYVSFEDSRWHVDFRMGYTNNFVNSKTLNYLDNYGNLGFGTSLYYRNIIFSYCFNPTTILRVKKPFNNDSGDTIRKYANTFWKTDGPYSINLIKHNFDVGYEIKVNKKNSFTPTIGFSLGRISIKDSTDHQKKLPEFYDLNLGFSYRRYIEISRDARFFYGIQSYASYSKISDKFAALGSPYWTLTINCGFKFVPRGFILRGIVQGLGNLK